MGVQNEAGGAVYSTPEPPTPYIDYWVDGHYIFAHSEDEALGEVWRLYGYRAETVRLWTEEDQAELDWQTDAH